MCDFVLVRVNGGRNGKLGAELLFFYCFHLNTSGFKFFRRQLEPIFLFVFICAVLNLAVGAMLFG